VVDYFSERFSVSYIRGAVLFAIVAGIGEILVAVRAPEFVSKWAIAEGILVLVLAYGVWKRSFASAIALLGLKTIGAVVWSYQSGRAPGTTAVIQVISYGLAAAAIFFARSKHQMARPDAQSTISSGDVK